MIKYLFRSFFMLLLLSFISVYNAVAQQNMRELALTWKPSSSYDGKNNLELSLVIKNNGKQAIDLSQWNLFFNSMYPVLDTLTQEYSIKDLRGNLFKVSFKRDLKPNDSLHINYTTKYRISGISTVPNGFYLLNNADKKTFVALNNVTYQKINPPKEENKEFLEKLYVKNALLEKPSSPILIFPTPKYIKKTSGKFANNRILKVYGNLEATQLFSKELNRLFVTEFTSSPEQADIILTSVTNLGKEAYALHISTQKVVVDYATTTGLFYALQSIKSLYKGLEDKTYLPGLEVRDEPRYDYRGFMLDIARNYRDKAVVFKYLEIMAENKLNVLHFHFIEDEAWRIEIPGLPELTDVGARRSPLYHLGNALQPAYGSGTTEERNYLTREDFIEILKYAQERHIQVIPEIETPGHCRAAIKSMEYRYHKYMKSGNKTAAEEYLLHDFDDQSEYNTAQNFGDNVLNPALPSVYRFLDKVITEFQSMYADAGVPFTKVSLGGDEVPPGVWEKSPKIKELMAKEGLNSVYEVWTYYISKINNLCLSKGLKLAGWEEIGMVNKGKGMVANPDMPNKQNIQLDVWNNIIGGGQDDLVYKLANAGFPTVLISASNTYFDMMWDTSFEEPGLNWATYADLYHSYSLFPEDYFANIHTYYRGVKLDKSYINKLERITEKGRSNFLGIKGGVFAETLVADENLDYLAFPRFYVLAERAWSPRRAYESEGTYNKNKFDKDYSAFTDWVGRVELPSIADRVNYRLPRVGLILQGNVLKGNMEYGRFDAFYTTDGSTPSISSSKFDFKNGIPVNSGQKIMVAVIDDRERIGQISSLDIE